jgi:hypothetical protein
MFYYIIDNRIISQAAEFDSRYYNYTKLTEQQTAFHLANPTASVSEVLAMELEPIPEPIEPTEPEPTIEERISGIEDLLLEML